MFDWLRRKTELPQAPEIKKSGGFFTTEQDLRISQSMLWSHLQASAFQRTAADFAASGVGMDANDIADSVKQVYALRQQNMPAAQVGWYASQSFIGYQLCALFDMQAVDRNLYQYLGLDFQKRYIRVYACKQLQDISRDRSSDQIGFANQRYQVLSDADLYYIDGWDGALCVQIN